MKFCTDYVAKGMGLVATEQFRKSVFFIYPIPKKYHKEDVIVSIKGPYGTFGHITVPALYHDKFQNQAEYKRAIYMSFKINSMSPTTQGTNYLRKLSIDYGGNVENEIQIRIKVIKNYAQVSYIPKCCGIHEISLVTNGHHLIGSPFAVCVDSPTHKCLSDYESLSDDESDTIVISKKYVEGIVDVVGEKMLLKENGTLEKIRNHNDCSKKDINSSKQTNRIVFGEELENYPIKNQIDGKVVSSEQELDQNFNNPLEGNKNLTTKNRKHKTGDHLILNVNKEFLKTEVLKTNTANKINTNKNHENDKSNIFNKNSETQIENINVYHASEKQYCTEDYTNLATKSVSNFNDEAYENKSSNQDSNICEALKTEIITKNSKNCNRLEELAGLIPCDDLNKHRMNNGFEKIVERPFKSNTISETPDLLNNVSKVSSELGLHNTETELNINKNDIKLNQITTKLEIGRTYFDKKTERESKRSHLVEIPKCKQNLYMDNPDLLKSHTSNFVKKEYDTYLKKNSNKETLKQHGTKNKCHVTQQKYLKSISINDIEYPSSNENGNNKFHIQNKVSYVSIENNSSESQKSFITSNISISTMNNSQDDNFSNPYSQIKMLEKLDFGALSPQILRSIPNAITPEIQEKLYMLQSLNEVVTEKEHKDIKTVEGLVNSNIKIFNDLKEEELKERIIDLDFLRMTGYVKNKRILFEQNCNSIVKINNNTTDTKFLNQSTQPSIKNVHKNDINIVQNKLLSVEDRISLLSKSSTKKSENKRIKSYSTSIQRKYFTSIYKYNIARTNSYSIKFVH